LAPLHKWEVDAFTLTLLLGWLQQATRSTHFSYHSDAATGNSTMGTYSAHVHDVQWPSVNMRIVQLAAAFRWVCKNVESVWDMTRGNGERMQSTTGACVRASASGHDEAFRIAPHVKCSDQTH